MIPLQNQEQFEALISNDPSIKKDPFVIIKFSAKWCGPCQRIDMNYLTSLSDKIVWYECDIDENDYTAGFCGIRTIPAFLGILNGKPSPLFSNSDTMKIAEWVKSGCKS
jgi:thiol-disulfide isomerase/thioredoxin